MRYRVGVGLVFCLNYEVQCRGRFRILCIVDEVVCIGRVLILCDG